MKRSRKNRRAVPAARPVETVKPAEQVVEADSETVGSTVPWYRNEVLLVGAILFLTTLVYLNSLSGQFLYDDWYQIERNPAIRSWSFLSSVFSQHVWEFASTESTPVSGVYYRPVFNLALLINYQLFGLNVTGWHIVSLLFHLGATSALYLLGRRWNLHSYAAAATALLFGVHPVHVEAVAWASALPDLMLGFFILSCLVFYEAARSRQTHSPIFLVASAVCALLAVGVKETGIVVPAFLLVRESIDAYSSGTPARTLGASIPRLSIFVAIALAYLAGRYAVLGFITKPNPAGAGFSFFQAVITVPFVFVEYLRMLVVPYPLAFIYNYEFLSSASDIRFWGSLVLLILLVIACTFLRRLQTSALLALALFVLFLLPALDLRAFNPFESLVHDRYLYLPSAGFLMLAGIVSAHFFERFRGSRIFVVAGLVAVTIVFGTLTFYQNQKWRDDKTASEHALKFAPDWPFLRLHLGEVYEDQGRLDDAENEMKMAIEIDPTRPIGYATLANFYLKRGRHLEAEALFEQAVARGSRTVVTLNNRAGNLINLGRYQEASAILNNLLTEDPTNSTTNYNLGLIAERESRPDLAEPYYQKAINKDPRHIDSRSNLAALLVRQNRLPEALEHISIVRSIAPDRHDILYTLAGAHLQARQCAEALGPLRQITSTAPSARAYMMTGLAYECLGQTLEARSNLEKVIEIAPDDALAEAARRRLQSTGGEK